MARVNISVPDDVIARARAEGLNVSRVATGALVDELDRLGKVSALDTYLAELEVELGPIPAEEAAAAATWVSQVLSKEPPSARRRRRSA